MSCGLCSQYVVVVGHTHMHAHTHSHTHAHAYAHTHTHIHTHTHTHTLTYLHHPPQLVNAITTGVRYSITECHTTSVHDPYQAIAL